MAFTEEQLKELEDLFEKYYRRKYPTFEVTGGGPTSKHDDAEYCLTTEGKNMLHFYKGGVGKFSSQRSIEIRSGHLADVDNGEVTGEGADAIVLSCKNGRIHIEAKASDIELNGRNISLVASDNIYLNAKKNIKTDSGADTEMLVGADFTVDATKELFINGGEQVGIHCESEVIHTSSGLDEFMAPDFHRDVTTSINKVDSYNEA